MAKFTTKTGGSKEFRYDKKDIKRIESTDTEFTRAFKEELRFKREHPFKFWWKYNKKKVFYGTIILAVILVIALVLLF